jgi:hypothetical protein
LDFEPVDCIGKLAALVPLPRAHLIRFHGVFALDADPRAQVAPSGRGKRPPRRTRSRLGPTSTTAALTKSAAR